jgi:hypothetical protein
VAVAVVVGTETDPGGTIDVVATGTVRVGAVEPDVSGGLTELEGFGVTDGAGTEVSPGRVEVTFGELVTTAVPGTPVDVEEADSAPASSGPSSGVNEPRGSWPSVRPPQLATTGNAAPRTIPSHSARLPGFLELAFCCLRALAERMAERYRRRFAMSLAHSLSTD